MNINDSKNSYKKWVLPSLVTIVIIAVAAFLISKPYYFLKDPDKLLQMGLTYIGEHNYSDALGTFQKMESIKKIPQSQAYIALSLIRSGKTKEALPYIKSALKLDKKNAEARAVLGEYYLTINKPKKGLKELHKSIKIKPNYLAYFNLGKYYYEAQNTAKAYDYLTRANDLDKKQLEIYPYLGEVYTNKGMFVAAFDAYEVYYNKKSLQGIPYSYQFSDEADRIQKKLTSLRDMAGEL